MKKLTLFIILTFAFVQVSFGSGTLIITQYYEGASYDKWIEVANVGDADLDLTSPQLYLCLFSNAAADDPANSSPGATYAFTGTISPGDVLLFQNSSAVNPTYASGTNTGVINFNGNDLIIISTSNSSTAGESWDARIDVIGNGDDWGTDKSFSRKTSSTTPSTTYDPSDWDEYAYTDVNTSNGTNRDLGVFTGYTSTPVELTQFTATAVKGGVMLNWNTATEVENYGFEIQKSEVSSQTSDFETIGFVEGHGNSNSPQEYSYFDNTAVGNVSYRLKQIDNNGDSEYSNIVLVNAGLAKTELLQNHPNPFNPTTQISFSLAQNSKVNISVYNALGQKVAEVLNKTMDAGNHSVKFNGSGLASGFYFYRLETSDYTKTMKMMLVK